MGDGIAHLVVGGLPGSGLIVPRTHKETVFDLSPEEWSDTYDLHVIPRFSDEPLAGKGIRHWLKQPENMRPGSS